MFTAMTQDVMPIRIDSSTPWTFGKSATPEAAAEQPEEAEEEPVAEEVYNGDFFRRVRALGDHPAVQDLNAYVDDVLLPAMFLERHRAAASDVIDI